MLNISFFKSSCLYFRRFPRNSKNNCLTHPVIHPGVSKDCTIPTISATLLLKAFGHCQTVGAKPFPIEFRLNSGLWALVRRGAARWSANAWKHSRSRAQHIRSRHHQWQCNASSARNRHQNAARATLDLHRETKPIHCLSSFCESAARKNRFARFFHPPGGFPAKCKGADSCV